MDGKAKKTFVICRKKLKKKIWKNTIDLRGIVEISSLQITKKL